MGGLRTRRNTAIKVMLCLLLPPYILALEFKSREELSLMPQTLEEYLVDHEDTDTSSNSSSSSNNDSSSSSSDSDSDSTESDDNHSRLTIELREGGNGVKVDCIFVRDRIVNSVVDI